MRAFIFTSLEALSLDTKRIKNVHSFTIGLFHMFFCNFERNEFLVRKNIFFKSRNFIISSTSLDSGFNCSIYCMSKKSCPILYSNSLYNIGQDLWDIQYLLYNVTRRKLFSQYGEIFPSLFTFTYADLGFMQYSTRTVQFQL